MSYYRVAIIIGSQQKLEITFFFSKGIAAHPSSVILVEYNIEKQLADVLSIIRFGREDGENALV
eukprot:scaffold198040_cov20-Cyclotella_meneghiniana.AAC.1